MVVYLDTGWDELSRLVAPDELLPIMVEDYELSVSSSCALLPGYSKLEESRLLHTRASWATTHLLHVLD